MSENMSCGIVLLVIGGGVIAAFLIWAFTRPKSYWDDLTKRIEKLRIEAPARHQEQLARQQQFVDRLAEKETQVDTFPTEQGFAIITWRPHIDVAALDADPFATFVTTVGADRSVEPTPAQKLQAIRTKIQELLTADPHVDLPRYEKILRIKFLDVRFRFKQEPEPSTSEPPKDAPDTRPWFIKRASYIKANAKTMAEQLRELRALAEENRDTPEVYSYLNQQIDDLSNDFSTRRDQ
jgi:hypothetical protein